MTDIPLALGAELVGAWDRQHDSVDGYRNVKCIVDHIRGILKANDIPYKQQGV